MKNRMADLRNHLFETLEALKDSDTPMDLARAKAIADVAQVVINSAKVEVDFVKAVGASAGSEFFGDTETPRIGWDGKTLRIAGAVAGTAGRQ